MKTVSVIRKKANEKLKADYFTKGFVIENVYKAENNYMICFKQDISQNVITALSEIFPSGYRTSYKSFSFSL